MVNTVDHSPADLIIWLRGKGLIPVDLIHVALDDAVSGLQASIEGKVSVPWPDLPNPLPSVEDAERVGSEFHEVARERGLHFTRDGIAKDDVRTEQGVIDGYRPLMYLHRS